MKGSQLLTSLVLVTGTAAFWRMPCRSQTGVGRLDPIMNPGEIADHVHTIHGGGNFGFNTSYSALTASGSCTSCEVTQDHSAYWTPTVHFLYDNGTSVMVPQIGGMLAYYLYYLDNVKAFPEGFQMIAGNKNARHFNGPFPDDQLSSWPTNPTDQYFLQQRALGFNCLNYNKQPEPSLYRHVFPTKQQLDNDCTDGLRLELAFPSCGTGAADSSDHKSHVAYPSLVKEGNCPDGYDKHYPFIFFETIWATNQFAGQSGQFVLSHGDPTGAGYHGDFMMGWQSEEFLQQALDACKNPSGNIQDCPLFDIQSDSDAAQCTFDMPSVLKSDDSHGPRDGLPVSVPVQYGPANATAYPCAGRDSAASTYVTPSAPPSTVSQGPTIPYSAVDPAKTSTALGGFVVNAYSSAAEPTSSDSPAPKKEALPHSTLSTTVSTKSLTTLSSSSSSSTTLTTSSSSPTTLTTPSSPSTTLSTTSIASYNPNIIGTTTYTTGSDVVELLIEETVVTVTATPTDYVDAGAKHRRHLDYHRHNARL